MNQIFSPDLDHLPKIVAKTGFRREWDIENEIG